MINSNGIKSTKEMILEKSIELFEEKGYEGVTIRGIASSVGIRGSSIYNHFASKEKILEGILEYHRFLLEKLYDNKQARDKMNEILQKNDVEEILTEIMVLALHGLKDKTLKKILKILSREQLKNDMVRRYFYEDYLLEARSMIKGIFDALKRRGLIESEDTEFLANEFHAFIIYKYYENFLLKQDYNMEEKHLIDTFIKHIKFFCKAILNKV